MNGKVERCFLPYSSPWKTIFLFSLCLILKSGNQYVFRNNSQSLKLASNIIHCASEFIRCASSPKDFALLMVKQVR